jgi:argininosuccinate lyase
LATEVADYLVRKGLPFAKAHEISGKAVALAEQRKLGLDELTLVDYQSLNKLFGEDIFKALTVEAAVASRKSRGGTAPAALGTQLTELGTLLSAAKRANTKRVTALAKLWGEVETGSRRGTRATRAKQRGGVGAR